MTNNVKISVEDFSKIKSLSAELLLLTNKINLDRFEGRVPDASDTVRATEISEVLYSMFHDLE